MPCYVMQCKPANKFLCVGMQRRPIELPTYARVRGSQPTFLASYPDMAARIHG